MRFLCFLASQDTPRGFYDFVDRKMIQAPSLIRAWREIKTLITRPARHRLNHDFVPHIPTIGPVNFLVHRAKNTDRPHAKRVRQMHEPAVIRKKGR